MLVSRFGRRSDVAPFVRAALSADIVRVPLAIAPVGGKQVLQLWVGSELVAAVSAELVGTGREGEYPLRLRALDPAHIPELELLADARPEPPSAAPPTLDGEPVPASEAEVDDTTLTSRSEPRLESSSFASVPRPAPKVEVFDRNGVAVPPSGSALDSDEQGRSASPRDRDGEDTIPVARAPRPSRPDRGDMPVDEDMGTLPVGASQLRLGRPSREELVSWNVRATPTTKDPMCGRQIAGGKYTLDSVIGSGAIGIVFKASHRDLGRTVAIKVLNPRYRDDVALLSVFRTEARAASQLEHPNVARVYDFGQEADGLVYIVMEYLSGYTVSSVIGARKRIAIPRALEIMIQTCGALAAAHERGIVHRDVKPDNLVIVPAQDDEGEPVEIVKVCDFGIAALGTKMIEGQAGGSPEYMAPEQGLGEPATAAADVYACGIVLYEMLTGEVPFTDTQPYRILLQHQTTAPRPPSSRDPSIPRELDAIILRALEKRPEARYRNARELRAELRKVAARVG